VEKSKGGYEKLKIDKSGYENITPISLYKSGGHYGVVSIKEII
jgi:hypothetical protein